MMRYACWLLAVAGAMLVAPQGRSEDAVFRSDVSLVRVDVQVLDRNKRAVTGLDSQDFMLRDSGEIREIRNFGSESMPVDIVLLLDVSGSMKSNLQRIADASQESLRILGGNDRVAVMVFDRGARLRLPFRTSRTDVERELDDLLDQETFDGGTDITRALLDAASYVTREGRKDARRAIVIVTDDQTERDRDEAGVNRALEKADAVLSLLLAPDAMRSRSPGDRRGGSWPNGPLGGPLGGIILGRRGPIGRRPTISTPRTQSAATAEIARRSGGDSIPIDDGSALQTTLARIRQRYALHYYLPDDGQQREERNINVELADAARRRYPDAEVRFRRAAQAGSRPIDSKTSDPTSADSGPAQVEDRPRLKRRPAVQEPGEWGTQIPSPQPQPQEPPAASGGGWRRVDESACGWRRVDEPIRESCSSAEDGTEAGRRPSALNK